MTTLVFSHIKHKHTVELQDNETVAQAALLRTGWKLESPAVQAEPVRVEPARDVPQRPKLKL